MAIPTHADHATGDVDDKAVSPCTCTPTTNGTSDDKSTSSDIPSTIDSAIESTAPFPCQNHTTHTYNFSELTLGTASNQQPYFRALIFFNKKPHHTADFFHDHWKSVHADLTLSVEEAGVNLLRYVQFHQDAHHKSLVAPLIESGHMKLLPFDGCAEFLAKDADQFLAFIKNLHESKTLVGCGKRFVDLDEGYHVMVGYDNLIFGSGIKDAGGTDGVLAGDKRLN